jgi:hypothetical protein
MGDVALSKDLLDFGLKGKPAPLDEPQTDTLVIKNTSSKKLKWKLDPLPSASYSMTFKPNAGVLDKEKQVAVKCTMVLLEQASHNFRVNLSVGRDTFFINVRIHADQGAFGVDPASLEQVEDHGFMVPRVLVQMRTFMTENRAWNQEGIFRLAGDASDIKATKAEINRSKSYAPSPDSDVNCTANLLKIWFRDLPSPILNALDPATIFNCSDPDVCIAAYGRLPEPQKTLLGWLLDMLSEVSRYKDANKMSPQNLAIVVAPNLYEPPGSDPMEGLMMSQKAVQFLHALLLNRLGA